MTSSKSLTSWGGKGLHFRDHDQATDWFHEHKKTKSMRLQLPPVVKPCSSLPRVDDWGALR